MVDSLLRPPRTNSSATTCQTTPSAAEPPIEVVGPRERARLQVEELDAGIGKPAEAQVDHGRPVDRFDGVGDRLVRPRAARDDHDFVKMPAKHLDDRAMMPARRVEASPIDGERSVHEGVEVGTTR